MYTHNRMNQYLACNISLRTRRRFRPKDRTDLQLDVRSGANVRVLDQTTIRSRYNSNVHIFPTQTERRTMASTQWYTGAFIRETTRL